LLLLSKSGLLTDGALYVMTLVGTPMHAASCAAPGNGELLFPILDEVQPLGISDRTNRDFFALGNCGEAGVLAAPAVPAQMTTARKPRRAARTDLATMSRRDGRPPLRNVRFPRKQFILLGTVRGRTQWRLCSGPTVGQQYRGVVPLSLVR
jgi:hypothetical protein